jgi:hypothetical protein
MFAALPIRKTANPDIGQLFGPETMSLEMLKNGLSFLNQD